MSLVNTKYGVLEGKTLDGYEAFLGIPYAKPPVGELRWKETQLPERWDGVREAKAFGPASCQGIMQRVPGGDPADIAEIGEGSEDCLYMNIWTPDTNPDKRMPVFVWIHGGAFCCGSGAGRTASPEPFVKRGIIYITFNYRLGIMGYFTHPWLDAESEHGVSGNYAHFDQIMALRWIKENIAAFGGDPENVTIGGCSAGAGSTQVLCNSPLARGLFARAIVESSVGLTASVYPEQNKLFTLKDMEAVSVEYAEKLGVKNLDELRALSYSQLTEMPETHFRKKYHYGTALGLCKDGYLLPQHYNDTQELMQNANVPMIVGNTHDEGGEHVFGLNEDFMRTISGAVFGQGETLEEYMGMVREKYGEDLQGALRKTHMRFAGALAFAALNNDAGREPVYVFSFARKDPVKGLAYHGLETLYLLGTMNRRFDAGEKDMEISATMQDYWCNFIKTGDPNGNGHPYWTPYSTKDPAILYLDDPVEIRHLNDEDALVRFSAEHILKVLREKNRKKEEQKG